MDVPLGLHFVVVRKAVDLVDEDFELDGGVDLVGFGDGQVELVEGFHVVVLGVDDEDEGAAAAEDHVAVEGGVEEVDLSGEVPDLELDEARVADVVLDDLVGALEEEGLVRGHLVEDDLLDRGFAAPAKNLPI